MLRENWGHLQERFDNLTSDDNLNRLIRSKELVPPALREEDGAEQAFERYKTFLQNIAQNLWEEDGELADIKTLLKDAGIKKLLQASVGYQAPSEDQEGSRPLYIVINEGTVDSPVIT